MAALSLWTRTQCVLVVKVLVHKDSSVSFSFLCFFAPWSVINDTGLSDGSQALIRSGYILLCLIKSSCASCSAGLNHEFLRVVVVWGVTGDVPHTNHTIVICSYSCPSVNCGRKQDALSDSGVCVSIVTSSQHLL